MDCKGGSVMERSSSGCNKNSASISLCHKPALRTNYWGYPRGYLHHEILCESLAC